MNIRLCRYGMRWHWWNIRTKQRFTQKPVGILFAPEQVCPKHAAQPEASDITNTPCEKCGDTTTALHTNGVCGNCYEPPTQPEGR